MATCIYVVRHGQDEDNAEGLLNGHRDRALTEQGRAQAALIAKRIKTLNPDVVIASPLQRARITDAATGLPEDKFIVYDDMKERDFGVLTGRPYADIKVVAGDNVLQTDQVTYFLEVEGAETFPVLLARAQSVLDYVNTTQAGKRVVLVGHGDLNKMVRSAFMNWSWEEGLKTAYVGNTDVIQLPPAEGSDGHSIMSFE